MKANEKNSQANVATKSVKEKVEGQIKEKNLAEIMAKLQGTEMETNVSVKKGNGRRVNSIYLESVYTDEAGNPIISKDEKKAIRRQIRKNLDKFLTNWVRNKNDKKFLESLSRDWVRSASKIYKNVFGDLYDGSDPETMKQTKEFAKAMQENLTL